MSGSISFSAYLAQLEPKERRVKRLLSDNRYRADVTREGVLLVRTFTTPISSSIIYSFSSERIRDYLIMVGCENLPSDEKAAVVFDLCRATL